MRPECGEQKTTGDSCSSGRSSVKGGVNSASIEARSLGCMSIWEGFGPLRDEGTIETLGRARARALPFRLCQAEGGLSISPLPHVVEDFGRRPRALFHCSFTKLAPDFW